MIHSISNLICIFIITFTSALSAQNRQTSDSLTLILEKVYLADQQPRQQLDSIEKRFGYNSPEAGNHWNWILSNDSVNTAIVSKIIDTYGWLGCPPISALANKTIFLVIQHSDDRTQLKYLDTLENAARSGRAKPSEYALLLDRTNMNRGKFQEYGSQLSMDGASKWVFFPIRDEPNVNKRRQAIGLPPIEEYAKQFEVSYTLPEKDIYRNRSVFTGYVMDTLQMPISGASVFRDRKLLAITDANGNFRTGLKKGSKKSSIRIVRIGYQEIDFDLVHQTGKEVYYQPVILSRKDPEPVSK
jgi:hypothetical protein